MPAKQSWTVRNTLLSPALVLGASGTQAFADSHVTLIEMGDLHGTLVQPPFGAGPVFFSGVAGDRQD